jgi:hypothetical protein
VMDRPVEILLESIRLADGRRCIFHPSRQSTFNLTSKEESEVRSERELVLGPGEACTVHSSCWVPAAGAGARVVV